MAGTFQNVNWKKSKLISPQELDSLFEEFAD